MSKPKVAMARVLHVTESHAKVDGGVTTVVNDLTRHIGFFGIYSCVLAAADKNEFTPSGVDFVKMGLGCDALPALFSSELKESIRTIVRDKKINIIHIHGVWKPLQIVASGIAKEMGIPFIVTLHGMLEPWLWTGKGWRGFLKKKLYFRMIAYPVYKYAATVHAITPQESNNLKRFFPHISCVTVPNAVDLDGAIQLERSVFEPVIFLLVGLIPRKVSAFYCRLLSRQAFLHPGSLLLPGRTRCPSMHQNCSSLSKPTAWSPKCSLSVLFMQKKKSGCIVDPGLRLFLHIRK
jgi:glycosyltransferase involved in cell wall biosynthesis